MIKSAHQSAFEVHIPIHLPPSPHVKDATVGDSVSCRRFHHSDACSRLSTPRDPFSTEEDVCVCLCLCEFDGEREGMGVGLHPGWLNNYDCSSLSQSAGEHHASWFLIGWLSQWAQLTHTHSQLVLWENEPGTQWERDREERQRYKEAKFRVCVRVCVCGG